MTSDGADPDDLAVSLGGRRVAGGYDRLRRYCGLRWAGNAPETWAYRYYDAIADEQPNEICRLDVLSTAALHPGLSRRDLAFFYESSEALHRWLSAAPRDIDLWDADADVVDHVAQLAEFEGPGITLLSKVLHRKRPRLVPLVDRHILDWYRPVTGERAAGPGWRPLLAALRADHQLPETRPVFGLWQIALRPELGRHLSLLRMTDIVLWTAGQWSDQQRSARPSVEGGY